MKLGHIRKMFSVRESARSADLRRELQAYVEKIRADSGSDDLDTEHGDEPPRADLVADGLAMDERVRVATEAFCKRLPIWLP